jgi:hypothetical protein
MWWYADEATIRAKDAGANICRTASPHKKLTFPKGS